MKKCLYFIFAHMIAVIKTTEESLYESVRAQASTKNCELNMSDVP